jgi:hypothetical protein
MYAYDMRRLQIMIDEDLDEALGRLAIEQGTSKAALIRKFVRLHVAPLPALDADPLGRMIGADDFDPAPVDDVVYS